MVVLIANGVYAGVLKEKLDGEDCNNLSKFSKQISNNKKSTQIETTSCVVAKVVLCVKVVDQV